MNKDDEKDHGGTRLTEGAGVSVSVPTDSASHDAMAVYEAERKVAEDYVLKVNGYHALDQFARKMIQRCVAAEDEADRIAARNVRLEAALQEIASGDFDRTFCLLAARDALKEKASGT